MDLFLLLMAVSVTVSAVVIACVTFVVAKNIWIRNALYFLTRFSTAQTLRANFMEFVIYIYKMQYKNLIMIISVSVLVHLVITKFENRETGIDLETLVPTEVENEHEAVSSIANYGNLRTAIDQLQMTRIKDELESVKADLSMVREDKTTLTSEADAKSKLNANGTPFYDPRGAADTNDIKAADESRRYKKRLADAESEILSKAQGDLDASLLIIKPPHYSGLSNYAVAQYYQFVAARGSSDGQALLGLVYENGQGLPRDVKEAVRLYKLSADQKNPLGQSLLGRAYENGEGLTKDDFEAVRLYRLAADQKYPLGQALLGRAYEYGLGGLPKDMQEAIALYKQAANQRNGFAFAQLSDLPR